MINEIIKTTAEETNNVITPANAISATGLGLVIFGALQEDKMKGTIIMGTGRVLDILDGKVARATDTSSSTGAMIDAVFDKLGMAIMVAKVIEQNAAPNTAIAYVVGQNAANAAISVADYLTADDEEQLQASRAGKYAMLLQGSGLGFYLLSNAAKQEQSKQVLHNIAGSLMLTSTALAGVATAGYFKEFKIRRSAT